MSEHRISSYVSTIVDLPPADAAQRLDQLIALISACGSGRGAHDQLLLDVDTVVPCSDDRPWAPLRSVTGVLRGTHGFPIGGVVLELEEWSAQRAQIGLLLTSGIAGDAYFRVGWLAVADLSAALCEQRITSHVWASRRSTTTGRSPSAELRTQSAWLSPGRSGRAS
jgi:hypothetical protein